LAKTRRQHDAIALFRESVKNAGMRPRRVVTDAFLLYEFAVLRAFGGKFVTHTVDSGFGENAKIERFRREIKRRVRRFSTFQSERCCRGVPEAVLLLSQPQKGR
jgi:transposase-like protein